EHDDFDNWQTIQSERISPNGEFALYHLVPGKGDTTLKVKGTKGEDILTYERGENARFTWDSKYVIFKIKPALDSLNDMKRRKVKEDKLPKDSLGIYNLESKSLTKLPGIKDFKLPEKWSDYVMYYIEKPANKKKDSSKQAKKNKVKEVNKENGFHLVIHKLSPSQRDTMQYVTDYSLAEEQPAMLVHSTGKDSTELPHVKYCNLKNNSSQVLLEGKGSYKQLALNKTGNKVAFLTDLDTTKALRRNFKLRYWEPGNTQARVVADSTSKSFSRGWGVSENGNLSFSDNSQRLFFGTTPWPTVQDTTLLPEEIVKVEVWSYKDRRLHTQQKAELDEDQKKSYLSLYDISKNEVRVLANEEMESVQIPEHGNGKYALGLAYAPYNKFISWEGFPRRQDVYAIDLETGSKQMIIEDLRGWASLSADGKYILWFNSEEGQYSTYNFSNGSTVKISEQIKTSLTDELNDQPNYPSPYGIEGWTEGDESVIVYDRYDIYQLDPQGKKAPLKLTNGRSAKTAYRYEHLDDEESSLNLSEGLVTYFNEITKSEGISSFTNQLKLENLVSGAFSYDIEEKAALSDRILFTKEKFDLYPEVYSTSLDFKNPVQLSNGGKQQDQFSWGTVELHSWISLDGEKLDGLLYKPANFSSSKKYPMIVNFYERLSDNLHNYWGVVPHRSIINPAFYTSRGYVVFQPDIPYKIGYPGESAFNAVIPGVTSLINLGFIDKEKIGAQGHSWGGYQTVYLVTKTDMFAAIESGAPVANMISAYGGIRWQTGLSRMFQYEHTQSRIGGTLWEYPLRYIENSPIFYLDKVYTPVLIMHNDNDGHVPWYQGIELFVGLRRLDKPTWMLNYNGEPHWPLKWENKRDFNLRMSQYFDHYLRDAPMPKWMEEGVPAILKGIEPGYEIVEEEPIGEN
ncbi:MAG: prolyl oligopeptidase family serine peptidase, partial [Flavobacteriaceae bacterium]|nr:prolyl oligopeptidase family serine peptidase [Flavobacteriaceae bacterium]